MTTTATRIRTLLHEVMESAGNQTPAVSARVRETRERLQNEWDAANQGRRGNPYTQEKVAGRIGPDGITREAYRALETTREPSIRRLREIAVALHLDEDYFLPSNDLTAATARVEAEAARLRSLGDEFESLLASLRSHVPDGEEAQAQNGH